MLRSGNSTNLFEKMCSGGLLTLVVFSIVGLVIFCSLFVTIHKRNLNALTDQHPEWARYRNIINTWIQDGPFKYGDFRLIAPFEKKWTESWGVMEDSQDYVYSYPVFFLRGAYLLQFINHKLRGNFSQTVMAIHNQCLILFSGALLGFLTFLIAKYHGAESFFCFIYGFSVQFTWQTFPYNLMNYWEPSPFAMSQVYDLIFMIVFFLQFTQGMTRKSLLIQSLIVLIMSYSNCLGAAFFLFSYVLVMTFISREMLWNQRPFFTIGIPFLLGAALVLVQPAIIKMVYPEIKFVGSGFLFRTGLDGNFKYAGDHWSLLFSTYRWFNWPGLFVAGLLSIVMVSYGFLRNGKNKLQIIILFVCLVAYFLEAFLFSQSFIIHPYLYDVLLYLPIILCLFGFLPMQLETYTNKTGFFTMIFFVGSVCYSLVQLRAYALKYPF